MYSIKIILPSDRSSIVDEKEFTCENNDFNHDNNTKQILLSCNKYTKKEQFKRKVTHMKKWNFTNEEVSSFDTQLNVIKYICDYIITKNINDIIDLNKNNLISIYIQEIKKKLYGYKSQDQNKNIYDETQFIDLSNTLQLLMNCGLKCFYCKNYVKIIYEWVREPNQWSLERLNNNMGHNIGNVVIACLNCNLKRNTMYHERYVFTKQMNIKKI
jgi:hypothetical protein